MKNCTSQEKIKDSNIISKSNIKIDSPIFIFGVGRSGTTLLQSMLNSHKDIAFTPETHFFLDFIANPKINKLISKKRFNPLENMLINNDYLKKTGLNIKDIAENLLKSNKFSLENFYKTLLIEYANTRGKLIIGDKDPKNLECLEYIKDIFPNAFVIHIIRDPRDVILSRTKAEWSKHRMFMTHILAYRAQLNLGRRNGKNLFGENYHEVFYEDLIENPEKELKNICELLDVSYDAEMLNFHEKADEIIQGEEKDWKDNCFKPVLSNNKNKWHKEFTENRICLIEKICRVPFQELGYIESGYLKERTILYRIFHMFLSASFYFLDAAYLLYHRFRKIKNDKYKEFRCSYSK